MSSSPALGALISKHECGRAVVVTATILGPGMLLVGGGLVTALFVSPEPDRPLGATIALAITGVALAAIGAWSFFVGYRKKHTLICLYEGGIVETVQRKRRELTWADIANFKYVTLATGTYVVTQLTIVPNEGRRWRLNSQHVLGLDAIANRLAFEVTDLTLPGMRRRLAAGERVDFGKLALSAAGIHERRRLIPWGDIAGVWVHSGYLRVLCHGDAKATLVVNGAQLERMDALLTLIRENCQRAPARAPFVISTGFRRLLPRLALQTAFAIPMAALFLGGAGYNSWEAFRALEVAASNHHRGPLPSLATALLLATLGGLFAVAWYYDLSRQLRRRRLARRLARDGKLVPVMVLENKFEDWSIHAGWRYRYLTPHGFEAVDRVDFGSGGAANWSNGQDYLVALCSPDERESVLISLSGYPLARLPATPQPDEASAT